MLRKVDIERKPDGSPVTIPAEINDANIDQQVKVLIELADRSYWDGQLRLSHLRKYHGGVVIRVLLSAVLEELRKPRIHLNISKDRAMLDLFFAQQLARHESLPDTEFGFPADRTRLPI